MPTNMIKTNKRREIIKIEKPDVFTYKNVIYWEPESQQLLRLKRDGSKEAGTLLKKAQDFLVFECIEEKDDGFICKPIKGYNTKTYNIINNQCNCQGFSTKLKNGEKPMCSHTLAVKLYLYVRRKNGN